MVLCIYSVLEWRLVYSRFALGVTNPINEITASCTIIITGFVGPVLGYGRWLWSSDSPFLARGGVEPGHEQPTCQASSSPSPPVLSTSRHVALLRLELYRFNVGVLRLELSLSKKKSRRAET
jgi:hypothetical protein